MPRAFAAETTIAKPAHDVWQALTDWSNAHRWMAGVDWLKADGETAPGDPYYFPRARPRPYLHHYRLPAGTVAGAAL